MSQGVAKDLEIRTAVEQVCGNRGALQLLVDLLTSKYVLLIHSCLCDEAMENSNVRLN